MEKEEEVSEQILNKLNNIEISLKDIHLYFKDMDKRRENFLKWITRIVIIFGLFLIFCFIYVVSSSIILLT